MARAPVKIIGNGLLATPETLVGNGVLNNDGMMLDYDQSHAGAHTFKDGVLLDDAPGQQKLTFYQEGAWTPTLSFTSNGTATVAPVNAAVPCTFTRIGNRVFISGYISIVKGTATGNFVLSGLPFSASIYAAIATQWDTGLTATSPNMLPTMFVVGASMFFQFQKNNGAGASVVQATDLSSTTNIIFAGTYQV